MSRTFITLWSSDSDKPFMVRPEKITAMHPIPSGGTMVFYEARVGSDVWAVKERPDQIAKLIERDDHVSAERVREIVREHLQHGDPTIGKIEDALYEELCPW